MARKQGVTNEAIAKRVNYAIQLKLSGMTNATILQTINTKAEKEEWGEISLRQLNRDLSVYVYEAEISEKELYDDVDRRRGIFLEQLETTIETMVKHIYLEKRWQPFEKQKALKDLFDMQVKIAELNNWDFSKFNEAAERHQQSFKVRAASRTFDCLAKDDEFRMAVSNFLDKKIESMSPDQSVVDVEKLHRTSYRGVQPRLVQNKDKVITPEETYKPPISPELSENDTPIAGEI